jgi:hypothetical protein
LDGSTIRSKFPATAKLSADVRPWVDEALANTTSASAYTLKVINRQGARTLGLTDEQLTLRELELLPSATLVVVPAASSSDAYAGGVASSLVSLPFGLAGSALGLVARTAGSAIDLAGNAIGGAMRLVSAGGGDDGQSEPAVEGESEPAARSEAVTSTARFRTLADQRADEKKQNTQLYNGNQVSIAKPPTPRFDNK